MKKKAVLFGNLGKNSIDIVYAPDIRPLLEDLVELYPHVIGRENLEEHKQTLAHAEVAFSTWGMPSFTTEEISRYMPNLKAVFYAAGSVQYFARPFLQKGIIVVSAWAANAVPVAEFTVAQILLSNKGFHQAARITKADYGKAHACTLSYPGNFKTKVGILGVGMIGSLVIERLKPYDLEIWVYDPFLSDERAAELGVKKAELTEIFAQCQTVSNHIANLPSTVGMLDKNCFDRMPANATFINTGRGAQVVEEDLIHALQSVPTRTAILDVTYPEPPAEDSPLRSLDNVWLTPHMAGSQSEEVKRMALYMMDEFKRYEKGEALRYSVTMKMLETMA